MLIITQRKRLLKHDTYDANVCMLTNKGSYIIEYQLIQTWTLINCNHV